MEHALFAVLSLSLAGTALGLLLTLLQRGLGQKISSGFFYSAWLLVLLRFVLPAPGLLSLPVREPVPHPVAAASGTEAAPAAPRPYLRDMAIPSGGTGAEGGKTSQANANPHMTDGTMRETQTPPAATVEFRWTEALFFLWIAGAVLQLTRHILGYRRFRRALDRTLLPPEPEQLDLLLELCPGNSPTLWRSPALSTPLLMGLLRPRLLLPAWPCPREEMVHILRHELTHYRRNDLAVKWFAAAVCSLHWFNPFVYWFREELDHCCELSCDERLLRHMDREEQRQYGELLLRLAESAALPRWAKGLSFATGKRNLKERLVQIMKFKKRGPLAFGLMLAALALLMGCAAVLGPAREAAAPLLQPAQAETDVLVTANPDSTGAREQATLPDDMSAAIGRTVTVLETNSGNDVYLPYVTVVHDVDEFLAALDQEAVILMEAGTYDLAAAETYGVNTAQYSWKAAGDGYELWVRGLDNLTIAGSVDPADVTIVTEPRYANVLHFETCNGLQLSGFTAGHTEDGYCSGGVLVLDNCDNAHIDNCVFYGCGTVGISAENCRRVFVDGTTIKECSYEGLRAEGCYDIRFTNGKILNCGQKYEFAAGHAFYAVTTTGFAVLNTEVSGNRFQGLLRSSYSMGVTLRGCQIHDNNIRNGMFFLAGNYPEIDGCGFSDNLCECLVFYDGNVSDRGTGANGQPITDEQFVQSLEAGYHPYDTKEYTGPAVLEPEKPEGNLLADGRTEYHVATVDEFLACIGSDTVVYLDAPLFDLTTATNYGGYGGNNYYWLQQFDGPALVITGVERLTLRGQGKDATSLETLPRYADVLCFTDCYAVTVEDLTAGHTRGAGTCTGDVLHFQNCTECTVSGCGLFGCGVHGIGASDCQYLSVQETEIYECSDSAAVLWDCWNTSFTDCTIRDCVYDYVVTGGDGKQTVRWDGKGPEDVPALLKVR